MFTRRVAAVITLAVAPVAFAGGTITSGNATYTLVGVPAFSTALGDGTLTTDAGAPDQLYKATWYYRANAALSEQLMSNLTTPVESYSGNTATITWPVTGTPSNPFAFNAVLTITLTDGAQPGAATLTSRMVITNVGNAALDLKLFHLVDMDLSGTAVDDTLSVATGSGGATIEYTEPSSANLIQVVRTQGAATWQVGAGSVLRNALVDAGLTNYTNSGAPFTGDGASANEFATTLQPGQQSTAEVEIRINPTIAPPCAGDLNGDGRTDAADLSVILGDFGCH